MWFLYQISRRPLLVRRNGTYFSSPKCRSYAASFVNMIDSIYRAPIEHGVAHGTTVTLVKLEQFEKLRDTLYIALIGESTCVLRGGEKNREITMVHFVLEKPGIILCIRPVNERRRYNVTSSLIGWVDAHNYSWENQPCINVEWLRLTVHFPSSSILGSCGVLGRQWTSALCHCLWWPVPWHQK